MASLVLGLVGVIQLESEAFISAGWPLWGPVRAFRGQQEAGRPRVGWGLVPRSLPAGRRGGCGTKPRQHSSWWWAVKWPVRGGLGAGRLSPDTRNSLYERIKSGALFSGPGNQGLRMLFCVAVPPPTHSPFFFPPFEPLLAVPLPPCLGGSDGWWRWARDRQSWGSHLCWGGIHWS